MADPLGRGDPHDWRRALDLDDPKFKLGKAFTLADVRKGRIHKLFDHRPRSAFHQKKRHMIRYQLALGTLTSSEEGIERIVGRQDLRGPN